MSESDIWPPVCPVLIESFNINEATRVRRFLMLKRERTKSNIVDAYVALLDSTDFDRVSVKAVCEQAKVVRSTFYSYFDDMTEVTQTVEDDLINSFKKVVSEDLASLQASASEQWPQDGAKTDWGFHIDPPRGFFRWFECCKRNRNHLAAMLGPHGDEYFLIKFRKVLRNHVNALMDADGMPHDELRSGFSDSLVEIHLLLMKAWLVDREPWATRDAIVTVLNSMRIGGNTAGRFESKYSLEMAKEDAGR